MNNYHGPASFQRRVPHLLRQHNQQTMHTAGCCVLSTNLQISTTFQKEDYYFCGLTMSLKILLLSRPHIQ